MLKQAPLTHPSKQKKELLRVKNLKHAPFEQDAKLRFEIKPVRSDMFDVVGTEKAEWFQQVQLHLGSP